MILITGATGQFGSKAIEHLLKKGIEGTRIAALVRDESKAGKLHHHAVEVRYGDYSNQESMVQAFQGVKKLLLVSSNDKQIENRTKHHISALKAAKDAGVDHVVYTSFVRKAEFKDSSIAEFLQSHVETENYLKDSGMEYTILQNGIYLEMIPIFLGEMVKETGTIYLPAETGRASWVSRDDLAEVAANILVSEGHMNKVYNLTNTESSSYSDIADELSKVLHQKIRYISPMVDEYQNTLSNLQVPEIYVHMLSMWSQALAEGMMDKEDVLLEELLGRRPLDTATFLHKVYGQQAGR
ncbi:SDR family oxidoreductase [Muricauda oceani]|uniref:SDR family oxidoreductase n=1 Tax=Flagellimonas oceani TaxID=2698672 RepID=A0A6G7IYD4_9FLAO|nr:SDR family oxidoreductase [Allomuricauda oceani]MBW8244904.1 SDR family oxidoreductase [Allomuricauda oceani]QII43565.1 SDR family oxidoreductase [Allomuricauda oceani]